MANFFESLLKDIPKNPITQGDIAKNLPKELHGVSESFPVLTGAYQNTVGALERKALGIQQNSIASGLSILQQINPLYTGKLPTGSEVASALGSLSLSDLLDGRAKRGTLHPNQSPSALSTALSGAGENNTEYQKFIDRRLRDEKIIFQGRKSLFNDKSPAGIETHNTMYWGIALEPYDPVYVPDNPYKGIYSRSWLPCISYDLTLSKGTSETLEVSQGLGVEIPNGVTIATSLTTEVLEDSQLRIHNYKQAYLNSIYNNYKRVLPYKLCCSKITIIVYNKSRDTLFLKTLLGYPLITNKFSGSSSNQVKTHSIDWKILGELDTTIL